jgi:predicted RNA-binding protein with PIN domain
MYLVDGNNVIGGRVGWHRDKDGARRRLLDDLARLARVRKLRLSVVFDGAPDAAFPDGSRYRGVKVFYARPGADADARIIEMVEAEKSKHNLLVVTSDGQLASRVRVCGVRVMRSGEFRRMLDETEEEAGSESGAADDQDTNAWLRYFGVDEEE